MSVQTLWSSILLLVWHIYLSRDLKAQGKVDLGAPLGSSANAKGASKKGSSSTRNFTARSGESARDESNMELFVSGTLSSRRTIAANSRTIQSPPQDEPGRFLAACDKLKYPELVSLHVTRSEKHRGILDNKLRLN